MHDVSFILCHFRLHYLRPLMGLFVTYQLTIDFNLGRIDPIPPVVELPETPKFLPPGEFAIMDLPRERKGDSKVTTTRKVFDAAPPLQDQKPLVK